MSSVTKTENHFYSSSGKSEMLNNHVANIADIDSEPEIPDNNEPHPCHLIKCVITDKEDIYQLNFFEYK